MKLSSTAAVLLGIAFAAFPGASAVSLRGIPPETETETETLIDVEHVKCPTKTTCDYGKQTCERINQQCGGMCLWNGSGCLDGSGGGSATRSSCSSNTSKGKCKATSGCSWDVKSSTCRTGSAPATRSGTRSFDCSKFGSKITCDAKKDCSWDKATNFCYEGAGRTGRSGSGTRSCSSNKNKGSCQNNNCYWDPSYGTCHDHNDRPIIIPSSGNRGRPKRTSGSGNRSGPLPTPSCSNIFNAGQCRQSGCHWHPGNGLCDINPEPTPSCANTYNSRQCHDHGCYWDNASGLCGVDPPVRVIPAPAPVPAPVPVVGPTIPVCLDTSCWHCVGVNLALQWCCCSDFADYEVEDKEGPAEYEVEEEE